jgi:hypothetical protein
MKNFVRKGLVFLFAVGGSIGWGWMGYAAYQHFKQVDVCPQLEKGKYAILVPHRPELDVENLIEFSKSKGWSYVRKCKWFDSRFFGESQEPETKEKETTNTIIGSQLGSFPNLSEASQAFKEIQYQFEGVTPNNKKSSIDIRNQAFIIPTPKCRIPTSDSDRTLVKKGVCLTY